MVNHLRTYCKGISHRGMGVPKALGFVTVPVITSGRDDDDRPVINDVADYRDPETTVDGWSGFWDKVVRTLPKRWGEILLARYRDEVPLQQIAEKYGVTKQRVCQLEVKALDRLRARPELAQYFGGD
ncbi:MAG: Sigma-70, region 4 [Gemmataceae bacterium]|nr:Sigma-70, region 4 [Gemmataceae bacterium]